MSSVSQQYTPLLPPKGQEPPGSRVDSDLCFQTRFCRLPDRSFLASGICPLVGGLPLAWCGLIALATCCPWYFPIHSTLSLEVGVWTDRKLERGTGGEVWKDVGRPPKTWYKRRKFACVWILYTHLLVMHKISLEGYPRIWWHLFSSRNEFNSKKWVWALGKMLVEEAWLRVVVWFLFLQHRSWDQDLDVGSLSGRWSQEVQVRQWRKWDREGRKASKGCIREQVAAVGPWGSILLSPLWGATWVPSHCGLRRLGHCPLTSKSSWCSHPLFAPELVLWCMMLEKVGREEESPHLLLEVNVGTESICSGQDPQTRCRPRVRGSSLLLLMVLLASPQNTPSDSKGSSRQHSPAGDQPHSGVTEERSSPPLFKMKRLSLRGPM